MKEGLQPLFNPSSIALIGASKDIWKSGGFFLRSLINHGFPGLVYPVNPRESEILGLRTYPSVLDIPGEVDLAIMTIPAQATEQAMLECAQKRVKFAVLHTAGYSETGDEGRELEDRVIQIARQGGVRVIGPNCMGIYSPQAKLNTIIPFIDLPEMGINLPMEMGNVAFVGQSGWASETFIISGHDRGLRVSRVISSGNQSDLDTVDYLEYFGADPNTSVIAAYLEGIKRGRELLRVAGEVSKRKPIIMWKAGKTAAGARAVASHTGSLAGSDLVYSSAFKQAGVIRAQTMEELIDFAVAFSCPYPPAGNRVGIIVEAGGGAVAAADACESLGLQISPLPNEVQDELRNYLRDIKSPSYAVRNPVDLVWPPFSEYSRILPRCLEIMAKAVDALLAITYYPLTDETYAQGMKKIGESVKKPLLIVPPYPTRQSEGLSIYTQNGIPAFPTAERAAKALAVFFEYHKCLGQSPGSR